MISVGTNPTNTGPDPELAIAQADAGLDALVEAAEIVDGQLFEAIDDLLDADIIHAR